VLIFPWGDLQDLEKRPVYVNFIVAEQM